MTEDAHELLNALLGTFGQEGFTNAVAQVRGTWVDSGLPAEASPERDAVLRKQFEIALDVIEVAIGRHLIISADLCEAWPQGFDVVDAAADQAPDIGNARIERETIWAPSHSVEAVGERAALGTRLRTAGVGVLELVGAIRTQQELSTGDTPGDRQ